MSEVLETEDLAEEAPEIAVPTMTAEGEHIHYDFGLDFQLKIAAMMARDTTFMQVTDGLVHPSYFEDAGIAGLVQLSIDYYARYKKAPGDKATLVHIIKRADLAKKLPPEVLRRAVAVLKGSSTMPSLLEVDISDRDFVADEVAVFARHQAVSRAILDSVSMIEKRDFEAVDKIVRKALNTGVKTAGTTYSYAKEIEARTLARKERLAGIRPPTGITTGVPVLDDCLYHKGWGRRELAVLMGGPKAGKSMAMISFSVNAIGAGYNVLYVTLEVAAQIISERVDANIAERAMMELDLHAHEVEEKVREFTSKAGVLEIKEFPSGTMRVSDLRRVLEEYKSRGLVFDLVVVDYADLMAPERYTDNIQENSKSIYVNLRGLAMEEGWACLTATQTNREGAKKAVATMTDIAEDLNKVRIADILISINKNEEEIRTGQARLYFAACRNQRSGFSLRIEQIIDQARFITKVLGED